MVFVYFAEAKMVTEWNLKQCSDHVSSTVSFVSSPVLVLGQNVLLSICRSLYQRLLDAKRFAGRAISRPSKRQLRTSSASQDSDFDSDIEDFMFIPDRDRRKEGQKPPKEDADVKLEQLERELAELREFMANLQHGTQNEPKRNTALREEGKKKVSFENQMTRKNSSPPPAPPAPPAPPVIITSRSSVNSTKQAIYTRRIQADSFDQLIKISSKVHLRSTGMPRSPGGTPLRLHGKDMTDNELFRSALFSKFKNVNGNNADFDDMSLSYNEDEWSE